MAHRLRLLSAIGTAVFLSVACAGVSNSGLDTQAALGQIRETYKNLDSAVARKDAAAVNGFLADDMKATLADGASVGKAQFAEALAARGSGPTRIDRFEFEAGKVVAVVTSGAGSASARETWRRENGGWKLLKAEALPGPSAAVATR